MYQLLYALQVDPSASVNTEAQICPCLWSWKLGSTEIWISYHLFPHSYHQFGPNFLLILSCNVSLESQQLFWNCLLNLSLAHQPFNLQSQSVRLSQPSLLIYYSNLAVLGLFFRACFTNCRRYTSMVCWDYWATMWPKAIIF